MRKSDYQLKRGKTPTFVSGPRAAAELDISSSAFHRWVAEGVLPPPEPGSPPSASRWRWSDRSLDGRRSQRRARAARRTVPHGITRRPPEARAEARQWRATAQSIED